MTSRRPVSLMACLIAASTEAGWRRPSRPRAGAWGQIPRDTLWTEVFVSARLRDMTTPRQTATKMTEAAQAWLERLDDEQRPTAQWAGPADDVSEAQRRRWVYTPTDHGGLN